MRRLVELGKISKPHGFKGDLVVQSYGGQTSAISYLKEIYFGDSDIERPYTILETAWMPKGWKLRLEGINSIEAVRDLQGQAVFALREQLKEPGQNEFYLADLEGAEVFDWDTKQCIGRFIGAECVASNPEQKIADRWWIEIGEKEIALPAIRHFVPHVDAQQNIIYVQNLSELE